MKVRNGFVSNSSSSSFIVNLPKDLDIDKLDIVFKKGDFNCSDEEAVVKIKAAIRDLMDGKAVYDEWEANRRMCRVLSEILKDYLLSEVERGGEIVDRILNRDYGENELLDRWI